MILRVVHATHILGKAWSLGTAGRSGAAGASRGALRSHTGHCLCTYPLHGPPPEPISQRYGAVGAGMRVSGPKGDTSFCEQRRTRSWMPRSKLPARIGVAAAALCFLAPAWFGQAHPGHTVGHTPLRCMVRGDYWDCGTLSNRRRSTPLGCSFCLFVYWSHQ